MKAKILITFGIILLGIFQFYSQNSIVASGGDSKGNGGSVSFSIGQIATSYITGQNGIVSEGVQYPYEIYIINDVDNLMIGLAIYPNPVADDLILKFTGIISDATSIMISNIDGQVLGFKDITDLETYIDMGGFPPSTYFLSLIYKKRLLKTFKIIKNKK
ncbi:MAG: T9SS type A sorting domain-containing protein [Saprospiraceae bacterium]